MALELDTRQRAMLQEMGVHVWLPESGVVVLAQAATAAVAGSPSATPMPRTAPPSRPDVAVTPVRPPSLPVTDATRSAVPDLTASDWTALAQTAASCQACGLCAGRSNTTLLAPLAGAVPCDWMVVGDAPDEDEDHAGAPFAAADGVLLDNMLRALGLQRANPLPGTAPAPALGAERLAYVSNVLKCRPAHGTVPRAADLAQCATYLQREIALVQPKIILAMGRFAHQLLLSETPALATQPLGKLRGTVHRYQGVPVVVSYHPKLLMRNQADKAKAWADLCLAADSISTKTSL